MSDAATVMLAGRAADVVLGSGANTGAAGDLEAATRLLLAAFERQGLGESLIFAPALVGKPSDLTASAVAEDLRCLLARAIAVIEADRDLALKLADRLIESKVLAGDEVAKILGVRRASGLTSTPPPAPLPSFANL